MKYYDKLAVAAWAVYESDLNFIAPPQSNPSLALEDARPIQTHHPVLADFTAALSNYRT